jgi:amino acid adenylation domain-containing protein
MDQGRTITDFSLVHQPIAHHAAVRPHAIAIDDGERTLSYLEMDESVSRIASLLQQTGCQRNDRIGLLLGNGIEAYEAMFAVLRADGCYVPMSRDFPTLRIAGIIDDTRMKIIITKKDHLDALVEISKHLKGNIAISVLILDQEESSAEPDGAFALAKQQFATVVGLDALSAAPPPAPSRNIEEDLAYIIFTSGTTGKPKGVMITHKNVKSFTTWAVDFFDFSPADRVANHASVTFDLSVMSIYCAFWSGAALCPVCSPGDKAFPGKFIMDRKLTIWISVPSIINMFRKTRQLQPGVFYGNLRFAIFCGEALGPDLARDWLTTHPKIPICNLYGPTEATVACTYINLGVDRPFDPDSKVPIGQPCRNSEILILDPDTLKPVAPGTVGKLMICGSQLSPGYWERPDLNAEVYLDNPMKKAFGAKMYDTGDLASQDADGILHYAGRADNQVKIQGYRVELGEIDVALSGLTELDEGVAVLDESGSFPALAAVVSTSQAAEHHTGVTEQIYSRCQALLPKYMVPSRVIFLPELPKNANGKIDRKLIVSQLFEKQ